VIHEREKCPFKTEGRLVQILLLSDIHGNLQALQAVLLKVKKEYKVQGCILLGDVIDYGMHSNEVIEILKKIEYPVLCNIWGNHEHAVYHDIYERFSSGRGRQSARHTKGILTESSWEYLNSDMRKEGSFSFECDKKKCLAVHGSLEDEYWGSIQPESISEAYREYDYVFSGHSHLPHFVEKFYRSDNLAARNRKKVIFINPGSAGQPRNLNNMAQFAVLELQSEKVVFDKAVYDISKEQESFTGEVDMFYRDRLEKGI